MISMFDDIKHSKQLMWQYLATLLGKWGILSWENSSFLPFQDKLDSWPPYSITSHTISLLG